MSTALIVKLTLISVSSGNTNLAQCRPNLIESNHDLIGDAEISNIKLLFLSVSSGHTNLARS